MNESKGTQQVTDAKLKTDGPCLRCRIGQHDVCYRSLEQECCCKNQPPVASSSDERPAGSNGDALSVLDDGNYGQVENANDDDEGEQRGSPRSVSSRRGSDRNLKDQQSTGRKRAAVKYPLDEKAPCEWAGLLSAGGGPFPIIGCDPALGRKQTHRHHGPDKNTLNNEEGNVHRICVFDHNRWHAKNDPVYTPGGPFTPHDPVTKARPEDYILVELEEAKTKNMKVRD